MNIHFRIAKASRYLVCPSAALDLIKYKLVGEYGRSRRSLQMNVLAGSQSISADPPSHVGLNDAGKFERGYRAEGASWESGSARQSGVTGSAAQRRPPINDEVRIPTDLQARFNHPVGSIPRLDDRTLRISALRGRPFRANIESLAGERYALKLPPHRASSRER